MACVYQLMKGWTNTDARFAAEFVDKRTAPGAKPGKDMIQSFINNGIPREELMQEVWVET